MATTAERARTVLRHCRLPGTTAFTVGPFDQGITVLSQQVRALNLAWALIEDDKVYLDTATPADPQQSPDPSRRRIAVVGAGFAGLTVAAGLLKKRVNADITVFEKRDTILPLQHGSDSRWLHPHIYDWPSRGSEAYSAALPVLNWTASRASDVVFQILREWADVVDQPQKPPTGTTSAPPTIQVYCNTRHIQISESADTTAMEVEWIGEARDPADPAVPAAGQHSPVGESAAFDVVVLAVGFGLEKGAQTFYWRNETLAQPHLGQARNTYIVSGSGDGALIDLFRLRISHFRQDRILAELFSNHTELLRRLRDIHKPGGAGFDELGNVWSDEALSPSTTDVLNRLRSRLRQDTTVLLRVQNRSFADLFVNKRVSFQNRLLAYLLYRCGAFTPVAAAPQDADLDRLAREHGVPEERIIIRHGTETLAGLTDVLAAELHVKVAQCFNDKQRYLQTDVPAWPGGYFDMPGIREHQRGNGRQASDVMKSHWRKEYLPSPTEAIATAFCSAVAGLVANANLPTARLRVTLHRRLISGDEIVLQQCCDYQGTNHRPGIAGRTFPSANGTIGAAFISGRVVHTRRDATAEALQDDMVAMSLSEAAQTMSRDVASVAAIPFIAKATDDSTSRRIVIAVLYLDSYEADAFLENDLMSQVIRMCQAFLDSLPMVTQTAAGRIANTEFWQLDTTPVPDSQPVGEDTWKALRQAGIDPPSSDRLRHLNFDFSDFTPVE